MPIDTAAAYLEGQLSVEDLVRSSTPEELERTVPACPLWRVHDVVSHLTGVARDTVEGGLLDDFNPVESWQTEDGTRTANELTDRHVSSRRDRDIDDVLDEWREVTVRLLPILRGEQQAPQPFPFIELLPVNDIAVHVHDIRGALRRPGERDTPLIGLAFVSYLAAFGMRCSARGLPPVRVRYGAKERLTGDGGPAATWSGDRFELFRALAGRRSNAQIAAMDWQGDATPYIPLVSMYGVRSDALVE
jgi:uncharacterized protein (TIGR03083 family)